MLYTGRQSILDAALGGYRFMGFALADSGSGTLELRFRLSTLTRYDMLTVTVSEIRDFCYAFQAFLEGLADF